jgi:hypothetical protein
VYCEGKSREMILAGTTADKMRDIYTRPHRNSIYEPATIHDIPFEVLQESFLYLLKEFGSDLSSPSLACRAWRVAAIDLMNSRKRFVNRDRERVSPFLCGVHLRFIVGLEVATIKHLLINLEFVKRFAPLARSVSSLTIACNEMGRSRVCYDALDALFIQCDGIRNLRLEYFDFGDDPTTISQPVKDGFGRLRQLELVECRGDIRMFVKNTPISNLKILYYESDREAAEEEEIITAIASIYRSLVNVKLFANFESSASFLKVLECCRGLERFVFSEEEGGVVLLKRSDILAVASLPRLKSLDITACIFGDLALPALARCKGLKELRMNPRCNRKESCFIAIVETERGCNRCDC